MAEVLPVLRAEEANLLHALDLARARELRDAAIGCLQGLRTLYQRTGRDGEWARLVTEITPDFTDPVTGGPLPGREDNWGLITEYRARLAREARDWPVAATLLDALITWRREQVAAALAVPAASLSSFQRGRITNLVACLSELGHILFEQGDPGCLPYYQETLALDQKIGNRAAEAQTSGSLGNAYLSVPGLKDLDQAEHWFRQSLSLRPDSDRHGRAQNLGSLGQVAVARFVDAQAAGETGPVLLEHLNTALHSYQQSLDLTPDDDHEQRGITESQLGAVFYRAGDTGQALRHYQQSIQHDEARGNIYGAGQDRYNIAIVLARGGRIGDALHYARAALANFEQAGLGTVGDAHDARQLIAHLEQLSG